VRTLISPRSPSIFPRAFWRLPFGGEEALPSRPVILGLFFYSVMFFQKNGASFSFPSLLQLVFLASGLCSSSGFFPPLAWTRGVLSNFQGQGAQLAPVCSFVLPQNLCPRFSLCSWGTVNSMSFMTPMALVGFDFFGDVFFLVNP